MLQKKIVMYNVHPTELAQLYSVHYDFFVTSFSTKDCYKKIVMYTVQLWYLSWMYNFFVTVLIWNELFEFEYSLQL